MEMDFENQTFSYVDFPGFLQKAGGRYMDAGSFPETDNEGRPFLMKYTKTRNLYGDYTVLDLKKYNIPMLVQDGRYLLPMQTLMAFTDTSGAYGAYFNGQAVFLSSVTAMTDPYQLFLNFAQLSGLLTPDIMQAMISFEGTKAEKQALFLELLSKGSETGADTVASFLEEKETMMYAKYSEVPKTPRSRALAVYGYNELCLEMDCFYGLKETHNITDFNTFFLQTGLADRLMDPDAAVADAAIAEMVNFWFDDIHSTYISSSCMAASDPDEESVFSRAGTDSVKTMVKAARSRYPESSLPYYEVGDTAYVTFDNFSTSKTEEGLGVGTFADYYRLAEEGKLQNDTISTIILAHQQIMRENSPVKNVVLDLSNNGGGEVCAALYVLSSLLGKGNVSIFNPFTNAQTTSYVQADVNLDRQFDGQDTLTDKGLNLYCLISRASFSSGNLVPWVLKADGRVTLLGKTSGGGSCIVDAQTTAWGTSFNISGFSRLSFVKNGAYYDVDKGVEPDHVIDSYDHFCDREALTEYIHNLY